MDALKYDFDADDTNSNLDWSAFQLAIPPSSITNSPFATIWPSEQDTAVTPDDKLNSMTIPHDNYFEIEYFFNGWETQQGGIEPTHVNTHRPDGSRNDINYLESSHRPQIIDERQSICLPAPLLPRLASSRSQSHHKLPDHAVKLMQEWYNAHLDDPYPRSPDKKRFMTEGNITAQQCRSWFANRRQRLKHVKRNQPQTSSTRLDHSIHDRLILVEEQSKILPEYCYYCQQQQAIPSPSLPFSLPPTATLNVVINQQTIEQLIHNSLRKLFNPAII